jgi:hypothetical protein
VGSVLLTLGQAAEHRGDPTTAAACYAETLAVWDEVGTRGAGLINTLNGAARLASVGERPVATARLLGAAATLGATVDEVPRPAERARCARAAAAARAALGDAAFEAAWAAGRRLTPEQAAAEAAADLAAVGSTAAARGTSMEEDVLGLPSRTAATAFAHERGLA